MIGDLFSQLRRDEGVRYTPYQDSLGNWTIGVGHLIKSNEYWLKAAVMTEADVSNLLADDVNSVTAQLIQFPWFLDLDSVRQGALTNMAFNLGVVGLLHFPSMIHCLTVQDWQGAHDQALNSVWARQVGIRANRIAVQLLLGTWQ